MKFILFNNSLVSFYFPGRYTILSTIEFHQSGPLLFTIEIKTPINTEFGLLNKKSFRWYENPLHGYNNDHQIRCNPHEHIRID
jgi:hypothetical protein